ncbi:MAG TPA: DUF3237 domain-containing protein [Acidimicrobiales bacterium]|nr:DUF3237 domain-containing protein [Acidimicrobiales bacterium]
MDLELEFTYEAELGEPLMLPNGPYGTRVVVPAVGGQAKGDRISGTFVGGGGDWLLVGPDGWGRLDVRGQLQTYDGALLYVTYGGVLEMNEKVMAAMTSTDETTFDDQYFRTTPRLETGDERYAWVNQTIFAARGRVAAKGVEYEVYRVT